MLRRKHNSPLEPTMYDSTLQIRKRVQKSTLAWWQAPAVLIILTLIFSAVDAVTLATVVDGIFTNGIILVYIFAIGLALCLNLSLVFLAKVIRSYQRTSNKFYIVVGGVLLSTFVILMVLTFNLRFQTRYTDISTDDDLFETTEIQTLEPSELSEQEEAEIIAGVLVLALNPGVTSLICFVLAYVEDPLKRKKHELAKALLNHDAAISELDSVIAQVEVLKENYNDYLNQQNDELLAANIALSNSIANTIKGQARLKLAEHLGDPESVSYITKSAYNTSLV